MPLPDWVADIASVFAEEFVGPELPLYLETFEHNSLQPDKDFHHKGALQLRGSANPASTVTVTPTIGSILVPAKGMRFEIDGSDRVPVSVSLSLSDFPTDVRLLRVVARFRTVPRIPVAPGPWSAAVFVAGTDQFDNGVDTERLLAIMKVKPTGEAVLAAPGSNSLGQVADRSAVLFPSTAGSTGIEFTLQLLLDLAGNECTASLVTPDPVGGSQVFLDSLRLTHLHFPSLWPQTDIGLGLIRAVDKGHVGIEARGLEVYGILGAGVFGRRAAELLASARRALLPHTRRPEHSQQR